MGDGERPYRLPPPPWLLCTNGDGEPGAFELKDERREEASMGGGGNMNEGVLLPPPSDAADVAGVSGTLSLPLPVPVPDTDIESSVRSKAKTDELSASLALVIDSRRYILGRPPPCTLGVLE